MALTIATGFVVDDAIVVLENTSRHIEKGMEPFAAALQGAREVGFTVLAMSLSLIAVFIPILLMGGIVGRLFREFAVTLSVAILVSLAISLTTTPMMCARLLRPQHEGTHGRLFQWSERGFEWLRNGYRRSLAFVLGHGVWVMLVLLATIILNVYLYVIIPRAFSRSRTPDASPAASRRTRASRSRRCARSWPTSWKLSATTRRSKTL
jgi:multidrug efflux pump